MITATSHGDEFSALAIFSGTSAEQETMLPQLLKYIDDYLRDQPGFRSAHVGVSEDGSQVLEMVTWKDRASYEAYRHSNLGRMLAEEALAFHPRVFFVSASWVVLPEFDSDLDLTLRE